LAVTSSAYGGRAEAVLACVRYPPDVDIIQDIATYSREPSLARIFLVSKRIACFAKAMPTSPGGVPGKSAESPPKGWN